MVACLVALVACLAGVSVYATGATAAPTVVHGSATTANTCAAVVNPPIQPPTVFSATIKVSSSASPQPHGLTPITLSGTSVTVTYPAQLIQLAVDAGLIGEGFTIPATVTQLLAASNTVEATHAYTKATTITVHVVGGIAQPLTATVLLPNTQWHPVSQSLPVVLTQKSAKIVITLDLTSSIGILLTQTASCTPSTTPAILTLLGTAPTTTTTPTQPTARCNGSTGVINSVLTNNGVAGKGLLYAKKSPQQFKATAAGQICTGGVVKNARAAMTVTTATPVNCQTLPRTATQAGVPSGGSGTFTWTGPPGMGSSKFNVQWVWISNTKIHFSGSVSAGGSGNNTFGGRHVSGNVTTQQSLAPAASGGNCTATIPLTRFDITAISYSVR